LNKKIFFWCPLLSHVGTINAVLHSAHAFKKYSNSQIFIVDNFGQLSGLKNDYQFIKFLKIFDFGILFPKTGLISKIFIYIFSILSIPKFIFYMRKYQPDILVINLVGIIPLMLKIFYHSNCKIVSSIQGYPKFNFLRKFLWKIFYKKSDFIITMSELSKEIIIKKIGINRNKIKKINNPVISRKIKILSKKELPKKIEDIFLNKFCITMAGRLTRQKNHISVLQTINRLNKTFKNIHLFILGEGELRSKLEKFISENKITNIQLIGFETNPYKYISRSKLFISSSLWEDPGHSLIEASYLNIPILTSDCPSGPKELYKNNFNSFVYKFDDNEDLYNKLKNIMENYKIDKNLLLNSKKISRNFTFFTFYNSFKKNFGKLNE
tara:strand:+ start:4074 stop:5216 length:1143 start_codon:yes stop_codon:yes gene_type:complete